MSQTSDPSENPVSRAPLRIFISALFLIIALSTFFRLPGVWWERGLGLTTPRGYTFHIDENTFLYQISDFRRHSPNGYVKGWGAHAFVLQKLQEKCSGASISPVTAFRLISLIYGIATIILTGLVGYWLFQDFQLGLWSAFFLAFSGLHSINSHFGTSDACAAFYVLLSCVLGIYYRRQRSEWIFTLLCVVVGAALAVKFQLSLLPLLALVCLLDERRWLRLFQATLFVAAGVQIWRIFNYSPWDFIAFLKHLKNDNISVPVLNTTVFDGFLFIPEALIVSLGFGGILFLVLGAAGSAPRIREYFRPGDWTRLADNPWLYFAIPAAVQFLLIAWMDFRGTRQLLPALPFLCLIAGHGAVRTLNWLGRPGSPWPPILVAASVIAYQLSCVRAIESSFTADPRFAASQWLSQNVKPAEKVTAYQEFSRILGGYELVKTPADYILTSSNEYGKYLGKKENEIYHFFGGPERLEFWNDLFNGRNKQYVLEKKFTRGESSLELSLANKMKWPGLSDFIPHDVVIFKKKT